MTCPVCKESLYSERMVVAPDCGHIYHSNCLTDWFRQALTCPYCNAKCDPRTLRRIFLPDPDDEVLRGMKEQNREMQAELNQKLGAQQETLKQNQSTIKQLQRNAEIVQLMQEWTYSDLSPRLPNHKHEYHIHFSVLPSSVIHWLQDWQALVRKAHQAVFWLPPLILPMPLGSWLVRAWMYRDGQDLRMKWILHKHPYNQRAPPELAIRVVVSMQHSPKEPPLVVRAQALLKKQSSVDFVMISDFPFSPDSLPPFVCITLHHPADA